MSSLLLSQTDVVVRGALDGLAARHRVYANNIANVDTPGFQPSDLPFEEHLREVRDNLVRDPAAVGHTRQTDLTPQVETGGEARVDGNSVNVDREVVRLADNSLTYEAVTQAARLRGEIMRSVISGSGK